MVAHDSRSSRQRGRAAGLLAESWIEAYSGCLASPQLASLTASPKTASARVVEHSLDMFLARAAASPGATTLADLIEGMGALADGAFDIVVANDFAKADYHVRPRC